MKYVLGGAFAVAMTASAAFAEEIKPTAVSFVDGTVEQSLTGQAGDPAEGRKVFANRKQGNCLACHTNADLAEESFHGEVGPPMDGVADRWNEAELRGIVTNSKMMFEGTIMPAFYVDKGYERPLEDFAGKSILTAQQVEDVVAYLLTLKEQ
ncbi:sulfur oxidation c-type cytochrome SoxX [Tateyamaria omphalii]|uniref:sulfur oxidation c-type cytochrome SoxX n=1 Tax=Tateyamaria omphalii TaxID=299262 RepID=UPI00167B187B|nr:sulfur oxidation c-type cytochrome SoxX [Tateyamaria omphalii]GGX60542.1 sulfur oxidation c-type cytochrome SoxX [Tateyamaria omphalii]